MVYAYVERYTVYVRSTSCNKMTQYYIRDATLFFIRYITQSMVHVVNGRYIRIML